MKKKIMDEELRTLWQEHVPAKDMPKLEETLGQIADAPVPDSLRYSLMQQLHNPPEKKRSWNAFILVPAFTFALAAFFMVFQYKHTASPISPETAAFMHDATLDDMQLVLRDDFLDDDPLSDLEDSI